MHPYAAQGAAARRVRQDVVMLPCMTLLYMLFKRLTSNTSPINCTFMESNCVRRVSPSSAVVRGHMAYATLDPVHVRQPPMLCTMPAGGELIRPASGALPEHSCTAASTGSSGLTQKAALLANGAAQHHTRPAATSTVCTRQCWPAKQPTTGLKRCLDCQQPLQLACPTGAAAPQGPSSVHAYIRSTTHLLVHTLLPRG